MRQLLGMVGLFGVCGLFASPAVAEEEWTTLKGRIVAAEEPAERPRLDITRDEDFCGPFQLRDESLLVHPENRGVQNVAIYLRSRKKKLPVHPSLQAVPDVPVQLDNDQCQFRPRMSTVRVGQVWQATNSDSVPHNVAVYGRRNDGVSLIIPQNRPLELKFARAETQPIRVDCSIHSWMRAYLVITDHPYVAVTDENGEFEIPLLPEGEWTFRFWHEKSGYLKTVTHDGEERQLKSGQWPVTLSGEKVDLGDILVPTRDWKK